jgi:hypothetical protein
MTAVVSSSSPVSTLFDLIQERNARETLPFIEIHASNADLWRQVDAWQQKCEDLERQAVVQQEALEGARHYIAAPDVVAAGGAGGPSTSNSSVHHDHRTSEDDHHVRHHHHHAPRSESAALRNERKMREQLEQLEEQLKERNQQHQEDLVRIERAVKETTELKEMHIAQEKMIIHLKDDNERKERAVEHLTTKVADSQQMAKLAEQQYVGLKDTIRVLQDENDKLIKEKRELETRIVTEKERLSSEMNNLTDLVDRLKREADMQRSMKRQEENQKTSSWFGLSSVDKSVGKVDVGPTRSKETSSSGSMCSNSASNLIENKTRDIEGNVNNRELRSLSVVVPSVPKMSIQAHHGEASCVR